MRSRCVQDDKGLSVIAEIRITHTRRPPSCTLKQQAMITPELNLKHLPRSFFSRDPRKVGRDLLGKLIIRKQGRKILAGRIVEVEAYLGQDDLAAHAAAGRTARNEVIFGPPGHAYVYFIYGVHYCLNVSCMAECDGGCV